MTDGSHPSEPSDEDLVVGAFLLTVLCVGLARTSTEPNLSGGPPSLRIWSSTLSGLSRVAGFVNTYGPALDGAAIGTGFTIWTLAGPSWGHLSATVAEVSFRRIGHGLKDIEAERVKVEAELRQWRIDHTIEASKKAAAGLLFLFLGLAAVRRERQRGRKPWWLRWMG